MDFKLSSAQKLQQDLFRRFAEEEVKPLARDMDEAEEMNMELIAKMQKYGFMGIPFPKEYGGAGSDNLSYALCMEEISKQDASTGITISVHTSLCCTDVLHVVPFRDMQNAYNNFRSAAVPHTNPIIHIPL